MYYSNVLLIVVIISVVVCEYWLYKRRNATYWRIGIPLYRASFQSTVRRDIALTANVLTKQNEYSLGQKLEYNQLSDSEIAFVECPDSTGIVVRRSHLMHGMIQVGTTDNTVSVVARLNWFPTIVSLYVFAVWLTSTESGNRIYIVPVAWTAITGLNYVAQLSTLRKVTAIVREYFAAR